jgi:nucleoside-diphosphate-sugar epimerase
MKLLFGHGYLGSRVARLWREAGSAVTVVTRSAAKAEQLRAAGYAAIVADVCDPATIRDLPPCETVLYAVGYDRKSPERPIGEVYADGLQNVLNALSSGSPLTPRPSPLVLYISSTGVYGDAEGEWVDESSPCRPPREGGRACLAAEQVLAAHPLGARSVVLRPAGIYGPGRIPRADAIRRGEPIDAPADGWLNLIHVDDLARIVLDVEHLALAGRIELPRTFCVSDGHPVERREYYAELARLLDAPPPKFVESAAVCHAVLRAAADKRINTARLLREIAPKFVYPSYREGLGFVRGR